MSEKKNILYLKDKNSLFDSQTAMFDRLFAKTDKAHKKEEALTYFQNNLYDVVIADLSVEPERVAWLKQMQDIKKEQIFFAILAPEDRDKLYGIADLGINAFELTPEHFDLALEEIAKFEVGLE